MDDIEDEDDDPFGIQRRELQCVHHSFAVNVIGGICSKQALQKKAKTLISSDARFPSRYIPLYIYIGHMANWE